MKKKSLYILTIGFFYAFMNNTIQAIPSCDTEYWYCVTGLKTCEWWVYPFQKRAPDPDARDACNKILAETPNDIDRACLGG